MSNSISIRDLIRDLSTKNGFHSNRLVSSGRSKSSARKRSGKLLRDYIWDAYDNQFNLKEIMNNNDNKIFLGVSSVEDLITAEIMKRRVEAGNTTIQRETTILCNRERWATWAENNYSNMLYVQSNSSSGFIIEEEKKIR